MWGRVLGLVFLVLRSFLSEGDVPSGGWDCEVGLGFSDPSVGGAACPG